MFLKQKRRIVGLIQTLADIMNLYTKSKDRIGIIKDCLDAIDAIIEQLYEEENPPQRAIKKLSDIKIDFNKLINEDGQADKNTAKHIKRQLRFISITLNEEIKDKLNVVFLPYKVSMWDSLESVYKATLNDKDCVARVVPIPYYELSRDKKIPKYEGHMFPRDIPVVYYKDYDIAEEEPDIIFVHNIYDHYNTLTQVYEEYFTSNLKKYTDMLVFVPYHISSFIVTDSSNYLAYNVPSIKNVDKVILAGEHVKAAAIRDGIPESKLLVLGSPKFDRIVNSMKNDIKLPNEWHEKLEGKFVFVLNTGCLFFANDSYYKVGLLSCILNIPNIVENSVLIWRPHPLTKISIMKYTPELANYYHTLTTEYISKNFIYKNVIIDETEDYVPALSAADVLISSDGSLLRSYLVTGKKVLYVHDNVAKNDMFLDKNIIPSEVFYYFYDKKEDWAEVIKKLAMEDDYLAEKRKKIAEEIYVNIDGTCGEKVYKTIKEHVINSI